MIRRQPFPARITAKSFCCTGDKDSHRSSLFDFLSENGYEFIRLQFVRRARSPSRQEPKTTLSPKVKRQEQLWKPPSNLRHEDVRMFYDLPNSYCLHADTCSQWRRIENVTAPERTKHTDKSSTATEKG